MSGPKIILVGGAPGSGKSKICRAFVAKNKPEGVRHLSVGELKRDILAGKVSSQYATSLREVRHADRKTGAAPSDAMIGMIEEFILERPDGLVLLDGFPRYLDRLGPFRESMSNLAAHVLALTIVETDEVTILRRLSDRRTRANQEVQDPLDRLTDHQQRILPTLEALAKDYPTYRLDGTSPPQANAEILLTIYDRHSAD